MRRVLVLAFVLLMVPQFALADGSPEEPLGWALSGGGFDDDILAGHIVLDDNNVVSAGSFITSAIFEEESVESTGMLGDADSLLQSQTQLATGLQCKDMVAMAQME